jgi:release factor H-coupled RctB family protein
LETPFHLFATEASWLEQKALDQARDLAKYDGVANVAAFPDLHAGNANPIGAAMATRNIIYPQLIGSDSGCGISLYATDIRRDGFKRDLAYRRFDAFEAFSGIPVDGVDGSDPAMGTIGGGNHFAEFCLLEDLDLRYRGLSLDSGRVHILIHSGSRGSGEALLRRAVAAMGERRGLDPSSEEGERYLAEHEATAAWAVSNRYAIARRCTSALGAKDSARLLVDTVHNGLERYETETGTLFVHRKGAAKADSGLVAIAGSRGGYSYLVEPRNPGFETLWSLAHGAGRKWSRSDAKAKLKIRYDKESIHYTRLGSRVFCRDRALLFEEAPEAYKDIERVIADLARFELIRVVARLKPLLTVKD